ncbi:dTDP-4-dehydrorhamnose reductase [Paenibacillus sp. GSMTC-2017]|uniref:dTDP-4-dehydrorhamnose reductase n=1 Tax=Paenibacillus sp. GSMTC-2017 TaxID=2794350 RepID=UPI0018D7AAB4|nr:dTDP-4-dehydrorhamnose reductase [Paenibacillus sp. GSMTC-2017]MBH5319143.1 dTDP-4-dehydrorhamnose reductase [Paenibacillus sp. GSMTC-2017]
MRVLVTGVNGQLGYDIMRCLNEIGMEASGVGSELLDLLDSTKTTKYILNYLPDVIIHCAAFTNVNAAEEEKEKCRAVNFGATATIAVACKTINAKLVYISTDYVFSGSGNDPYETDSTTKPLSFYGQTKLEGENEVLRLVDKHFIIRTSWAFGENGNNFVKTMLNLSKERQKIDVVSDQIGSPTYTKDLALLIIDMIKTDKYGVYHATNEGYCSWAEFAAEIFRQTGSQTRVNFINSEEYDTSATRPKNSRLSKKSLDINGFNRLPEWQDALHRYLISTDNIN